MADNRPTNIPANSLMVFTKGRLFLMFTSAMLIGTSFFFFGLYTGYQTGKNYLIKEIKSALKKKRELKNRDKKQLMWLEDHKKPTFDKMHSYVVHIGLFGSEYNAQAIWNEIADYSRLTEKEAIKKVKINNDTFYQVNAGVFDTREHAQTFAEMVHSRTHNRLTPAIKRIPKIQAKEIKQEKSI